MIHSIFVFAADVAAEAVEGPGGLFDINATLPLMALQFLALMWVLDKILYKPLGEAIDSRDGFVRESLSDAKTRLAKAEELTHQYEQELASTRRQAQEVIVNAQSEAQAIATEKVAEAQQEAQSRREQAQAELDQQKQAAMQSLELQVGGLSRQIMAKLLGSQV